MTPEQEKLHRFPTDKCGTVWKAAFDDKLGIPEVRILIILDSQSTNEKPQLYSTRAISVMIGASHATAVRAIRKLLDNNYITKVGNNYFLGVGLRFKNESDPIQKCIESDSKMNQERFKNESTIIQTNNTKNNTKNKEPLTPFQGELLLPPHLDTNEVRQSILTWLQYKKEKGQGYKATGLKGLFTKLGKDYQNENDLVSAIEGSISKNYAGIFPCLGSTSGSKLNKAEIRSARMRELVLNNIGK